MEWGIEEAPKIKERKSLNEKLETRKTREHRKMNQSFWARANKKDVFLQLVQKETANAEL